MVSRYILEVMHPKAEPFLEALFGEVNQIERMDDKDLNWSDRYHLNQWRKDNARKSEDMYLYRVWTPSDIPGYRILALSFYAYSGIVNVGAIKEARHIALTKGIAEITHRLDTVSPEVTGDPFWNAKICIKANALMDDLADQSINKKRVNRSNAIPFSPTAGPPL